MKNKKTISHLQKYSQLCKGFKVAKTPSEVKEILKNSLLITLPVVGLANVGHAQIKTDPLINQTDTHADLNASGGYAERLWIAVDDGFTGGGEHVGFVKAPLGSPPAGADFHVRMNPASIWIVANPEVKFRGAGTYPLKLSSGASINGGNVAAGYNGAGYTNGFWLTYNNQAGGNWNGSGEQVGYVGFSFEIGSNTHFGFMEIGVTPDDDNPSNGAKKFRLIGIGYEQTPNAPINTILPVELSNFQVTTNRSNLALTWQTATETNNAGFEVQRSTDGQTFRTLKFIEGQGTSYEQQDYHYDDKDLRKNQTYYYRLKQIDYDGQFAYSEVITARLEGSELAGTFAPNPTAQGHTNLNYSASEAGELNLQIFDVSGKLLLQQMHSVVTGENILNIQLAGLSQGMYFVKMQQGERQGYEKLIIE